MLTPLQHKTAVDDVAYLSSWGRHPWIGGCLVGEFDWEGVECADLWSKKCIGVMLIDTLDEKLGTCLYTCPLRSQDPLEVRASEPVLGRPRHS